MSVKAGFAFPFIDMQRTGFLLSYCSCPVAIPTDGHNTYWLNDCAFLDCYLLIPAASRLVQFLHIMFISPCLVLTN